MNAKSMPPGSQLRAGAKATGAANTEASSESRMSWKLWKGYKTGFMEIADLRLTMYMF